MQNLATNALLRALNRAIAELLSIDPDGVRELAKLRGKVFCLEVNAPQVTLYLVPTEHGIAFQREVDSAPQVTLSGSSLAFAKLGRNGLSGVSTTNVFTEGRIVIRGDAELGYALQKTLSRLDLDWEELLSRYIGDTPARKVGNILRGLANWAEDSGELTRENVADYLTEEKPVLVNQLSAERFAGEVDCIRADVDRLTLRVNDLSLAVSRQATQREPI